MTEYSISLAQIRTCKMQRLLGMLGHRNCKRCCRFSPERALRGFSCLSIAVIYMNLQTENFRDLVVLEIQTDFQDSWMVHSLQFCQVYFTKKEVVEFPNYILLCLILTKSLQSCIRKQLTYHRALKKKRKKISLRQTPAATNFNTQEQNLTKI